jgi:hypothetical protein
MAHCPVVVQQYTQLDHHSTSVFAINTNHQLAVQFLVATKYKKFHDIGAAQVVVIVHNQNTLFDSRGSLGTDDIHAVIKSSFMVCIHVPFLAHVKFGHFHLSCCDVIIAV